MDFYAVLKLLGVLLRLLGALAFGIMGGWFSLYVIEQQKERWELILGVFLGFFFFITLFARVTSAGATGAYLLGVSSAILIWGTLRLQDRKSKKEEEEGEQED
ncbi:MAG: hypothetical protein J7L73_05705 [Anaerolineales bacterium]|nr:hypothetical protein [Anaerolineales bacterium]